MKLVLSVLILLSSFGCTSSEPPVLFEKVEAKEQQSVLLNVLHLMNKGPNGNIVEKVGRSNIYLLRGGKALDPAIPAPIRGKRFDSIVLEYNPDDFPMIIRGSQGNKWLQALFSSEELKSGELNPFRYEVQIQKKATSLGVPVHYLRNVSGFVRRASYAASKSACNRLPEYAARLEGFCLGQSLVMDWKETFHSELTSLIKEEPGNVLLVLDSRYFLERDDTLEKDGTKKNPGLLQMVIEHARGRK